MRLWLLVGCLVGVSLGCDKSEDEPIPCGEQLSCAGDEVCVEDRIDASCSSMEEGAACPDGTTAGQCGGAGLPCCCAPPPASEYRCEPAGACGGEPACACLPGLCTDDKDCEQKDEGSPQFACESLPAA